MVSPRPQIPQIPQIGAHRQLETIVRRHLGACWRQPIRAHTANAFAALAGAIDKRTRVVLDSGCGSGASTAGLAERHPECLVIGIDKSVHRLSRSPRLPANARLLRAELSDFWRLAVAAGWRLERHCLWYPNPWPKSAHLKRRWHGHPVFPWLAALGGKLELRTNTGWYGEEFALALRLIGIDHAAVVSFCPDQPVSPFERKYHAGGQRLFRVEANLSIWRKPNEMHARFFDGIDACVAGRNGSRR